MKFFLIGGGTQRFLKNGVVEEFFLNEGISRILFLGFHHTDPEKSLENLQVITNKMDIAVDDLNLNGVDFSIYDAIYVTGGDEQILFQRLRESGIFDNFRKWFDLKSSKAYIGSSAGVQILGKKYFAWGRHENPYLLGLKDDGLGVFPKSIFEVHCTEKGLWQRLKLTIENDPEVDFGLGIDESSAVIIDSVDPVNPKVVSGGVHISEK